MSVSLTVRQKILTIAAVSLAVHVFVAAFFTHQGDPAYWPTIMGNINSGNGLYGLDGNYYTPVWGYMLGFLDLCINIFGLVPFMGEVFEELLEWATVSVADPLVPSPQIMLAIKIPLGICDVIVGYQIFKIVREFTDDDNKAVIAMAMWCFCPMVIYMASVQGQFDTISTFIALTTIRLLRNDRPLLAGVMFGFGVWLKLFPGVCLFLFVGYLIKRYGKTVGIRKTVIAAVGAAIVSVILIMPQVLDGQLDIVFGFFTGRMNTTTDSDFYNKLVSVRLILMILLMLALMVWSFIGIQRRHKDIDRYLYLYAGVLITVATIISRGYQYVPSFIGFVLLFAMMSDDRRSYRGIFYLISVLTVFDAFFSPGPSLLAIPAVYYGILDAQRVESITIAFLTSVGHASDMPIGWSLAIAWAVLQWVFVLFALSDLLFERYPKLKHKIERIRKVGVREHED